MRDSHIDDLLINWEYDPRGVNARIVEGSDGRDVIQMRVDMGILQLETEGRPDGSRPHGAESYFDFLLNRSLHRPEFELDEDQCSEVDREFVQFYHRRICWLQLNEFALAVRDADHTLGLMDYCRNHSPDEQWTMSHEQYRRFVLFHRTQASALAELDATSDAEEAINQINVGLEKLREVLSEYDCDEDFEDDEIVHRLVEMREQLREKFGVDRTLQEQLRAAVAAEQYELAARLRDQLERRGQS